MCRKISYQIRASFTYNNVLLSYIGSDAASERSWQQIDELLFLFCKPFLWCKLLKNQHPWSSGNGHFFLILCLLGFS